MAPDIEPAKSTAPDADQSPGQPVTARTGTPPDTADDPDQSQTDGFAQLRAHHGVLRALLGEAAKITDAEAAGSLLPRLAEAWSRHAEAHGLVHEASIQAGLQEFPLLAEVAIDSDLVSFLLGRAGRDLEGPLQLAAVRVAARLIGQIIEREEKPRGGLFAKAKAAGVDPVALGGRIRACLTAPSDGDGDAGPRLRHLMANQEEMMARNSNMPERDERGRFVSDDDEDGRGGRGSGRYDDDRDRRGRSASSRDDDRGRRSRDDDDRDRDSRGRFTSDRDDDRGRRSRDDDDRDRDSRGRFASDRDDDRGRRSRDDDDRDRDSRGRFASDRDDDRGRRSRDDDDRDRDSRGRFTSGRDDDRYGSRGRSSRRDDDDDRRYAASRRDDDNRRSSSSRGRDDDDDSRDRGQGWFGDSRGHAEAARRGWDHRRDDDDDRYGSRGRSSRRDDDDDRRYAASRRDDDDRRSSSSRGRDDDDDSRGQGWFGDSRGHAEAARRGWEHRRDDDDDRSSSRGRR